MKGILIVVGGSEHKGIPGEKEPQSAEFVEMEILKRVVAEMQDKDQCLEVITTASAGHANELYDNYRSAFTELGCKKVCHMDIRAREDAFLEENVERAKIARAFMFTGGDQLRLSTILGGTPVLEAIRHRLAKENIVVAGTSAGAMVMSNSMIYSGASDESFYKGNLKITSGFGFFPGVIIDTHFVRRGRFGRLAHAVAVNPSYIGVGLEENTGVVVTNGDKMEVIGSGNMLIVDGHTIKGTNYIEIDEGAPLSIDNMTVHILSKEDEYHVLKRKFVSGWDK